MKCLLYFQQIASSEFREDQRKKKSSLTEGTIGNGYLGHRSHLKPPCFYTGYVSSLLNFTAVRWILTCVVLLSADLRPRLNALPLVKAPPSRVGSTPKYNSAFPGDTLPPNFMEIRSVGFA